MGFLDDLFGNAPFDTPEAIKPPMFDFSSLMGQYLSQLLQGGNTAAPANPYNLGQPLSPTMQMQGRMAQGFALSPAPYVMGQAAGTLGQHMQPNFNLDATKRMGGMLEGRDILNLFQSRPQIEGRAYGGPVNPGQPYMVGERGPEMMIPQQPGMIAPNPLTPQAPPFNPMMPALGMASPTAPMLPTQAAPQATSALQNNFAGGGSAGPSPMPPGRSSMGPMAHRPAPPMPFGSPPALPSRAGAYGARGVPPPTFGGSSFGGGSFEDPARRAAALASLIGV